MVLIWKAVRGAAKSDALLAAWKARFAVLIVIPILLIAACSIGGSSGSSVETCGAGEIGTAPNCFTTPPAPAAPGKTWHVVFSEEFNGNDYDHSKLTPCFDWNYGFLHQLIQHR